MTPTMGDVELGHVNTESSTKSALSRQVSRASHVDGDALSRQNSRRRTKPVTVADEQRFSEAGLEGLSTAEAERLLQEHGKNEIPEDKVPTIVLFLKQFVGVMPATIIVCIILAAAAEDWVDFAVILGLLIMNSGIGFREEVHAANALDDLRGDLTQEIQAKRDGKPVSIDVTLLVPGDIVQLKGGDVIPADCVWTHGDMVKVDTSPLTGEPIPWSVPRKDSEGKGKLLWAGCTVQNGECLATVQKTGVETEIGGAFSAAQDQGGSTKSGFEKKILLIVSLIIAVAAILAIILIVVQNVAREIPVHDSLLAGVSLLIGSVPVALPLVLVVTMAIGSVQMSNYQALVTNLPALQEIASMTVLCSDKTGTLTTAKMDVQNDLIFTLPGWNPNDVFEMAVACCNRTNMGDAIDGGIMRKYDSIHTGGDADAGAAHMAKKYKCGKSNGFHNAAKRTVHEIYNVQTGETFTVAKGLVTKLLNCIPKDPDDDHEAECEHPQWKAKDYDQIKDEIEDKDTELGVQGYKTIGLGVAKCSIDDLKAGKADFVFAGLVPMIDPPRMDTALTIKRIREAGVEVKMITGDHQNIAKTTAGLINLGTNILSSTQLAVGPNNPPNVRDKLIREADGFAQVLPTDKMDVVLTLQNYGMVVGFSGDGVNDVPALAAAEVGVAVHGATDAANATADIQLLSPGLSAIYTAVIESRKIFRRIKAYVIYRVAATIQMIIVLTTLTLVSGCMIDSLYIVIIAIMNDLSMLPLSSDRQRAAKNPDRPIVWKMLLMAVIFGVLEAGMTLVFFYLGGNFNATEGSSTGVCGMGADGTGLRTGWFTDYANDQSLYEDNDDFTDYTQWTNYKWQPMQQDAINLAVTQYCPNNGPNTWGGANTCPGRGSFWSNTTTECLVYGENCVFCPSWKTTDRPTICPPVNNPLCVPVMGNSRGPSVLDCSFYTTSNSTTTLAPMNKWEVAAHSGLVSPTTAWAGDPDCPCSELMNTMIFLQLLVSAEFLIFPMRTLSWMWSSMASPWLYASTLFVNILFSILAATGEPSAVFKAPIGWGNMGYVWAFSAVGLILIDIVKVLVVIGLEGSTEEIPTDKEVIDANSCEAEEAAEPQGPTANARRKTSMLHTKTQQDGTFITAGARATPHGSLLPGSAQRAMTLRKTKSNAY